MFQSFQLLFLFLFISYLYLWISLGFQKCNDELSFDSVHIIHRSSSHLLFVTPDIHWGTSNDLALSFHSFGHSLSLTVSVLFLVILLSTILRLHQNSIFIQTIIKERWLFPTIQYVLYPIARHSIWDMWSYYGLSLRMIHCLSKWMQSYACSILLIVRTILPSIRQPYSF